MSAASLPGLITGLILFTVAFAVASRRLLGLRIGIVRSLLTGAVGSTVVMILSEVQKEEQSGLLLGVQLGTTLVVAMAFLAGLEVVAPSGSLGWPNAWWAALRSSAARARRYSGISSIVVRHGLRPYLRGREARSTGLAVPLRRALEEAGGTFVKLGQVLATRDDLLPPALVRELSVLQYQVPPEPLPDIRSELVREYGRPAREVFASFDEDPLAAASIAQVHRARLVDGTEVVVKIRRPGIRAGVERDLDVICRLARQLERRTGWAVSLGLVELADNFARSVQEELDFRIEAQNLDDVADLRERHSGPPRVRLPGRHRELSSERVLVLDHLPGDPISTAFARLDELPRDRAELARELLGELMRQILVDGVFHADPHPGNILLLADGDLALIDFGSVGRIDAQSRSALKAFLVALQSGQAAAMSDALLDVLTRPEEVDTQRLERDLGRFLARHFNSRTPPSVQAFVNLFRIVTDHGLRVPAEIAAVFRSLATLEGTLTRIAPGFDLMAEARDLSTENTLGAGPSQRSVQETLQGEFYSALTMLRRLPRRLDRVTQAMERGQLTVSVRPFADARDRRYLRSLMHEALLVVVSSASGLTGAVMLTIDDGPRLTQRIDLFELVGYHLLVLAAVLLVRALSVISRHKE
ncbi:ABC1 kinase family protein [Streptomyces profundus]|uniref:ABC1 kinase family protein n=1 Tax=Streptomyces profundus TaxID=2867410 RepID=UPI001D164F26|nr:AarF/UbiB family protein [Streptomyces sp. MA3_2.13]UED85094.1 AarF/ABC1/UbiB kinase family protein [Streptomyces sp. MA3_2.13]